MKEVKKMNNAPLSACHLLYLLRPIYALEMDYNDYIKQYKFIVIDGVGYCSDEKEEWRVCKWLKSPEISIRSMALPDAIVVGKAALKNRYGHNRISEKINAMHKAFSNKKITLAQYQRELDSFTKLFEV